MLWWGADAHRRLNQLAHGWNHLVRRAMVDHLCSWYHSPFSLSKGPQGKSRRLVIFRKNCKKLGVDRSSLELSGVRRDHVFSEGSGFDLGVEFTSLAGLRCLCAMTKSPKEEFGPFLFLDGTREQSRICRTLTSSCVFAETYGF
jgi:hypothetical protein